MTLVYPEFASSNHASVPRGSGGALALSQRELARRAGVTQPVLSRIERGHSSPRFDTLDQLLRQCGKGLELVERPGLGVDRSLIRDHLRLSPGARARLAVRELERTRTFDRRNRPTT